MAEIAPEECFEVREKNNNARRKSDLMTVDKRHLLFTDDITPTTELVDETEINYGLFIAEADFLKGWF